MFRICDSARELARVAIHHMTKFVAVLRQHIIIFAVRNVVRPGPARRWQKDPAHIRAQAWNVLAAPNAH